MVAAKKKAKPAAKKAVAKKPAAKKAAAKKPAAKKAAAKKPAAQVIKPAVITSAPPVRPATTWPFPTPGISKPN